MGRPLQSRLTALLGPSSSFGGDLPAAPADHTPSPEERGVDMGVMQGGCTLKGWDLIQDTCCRALSW